MSDTNDTPAQADTHSYRDAITELESILGALEGDDLDVDALAHKVARAAELIELCRGRIETARTEVERVVVGLDGNGARDDAPGEPG